MKWFLAGILIIIYYLLTDPSSLFPDIKPGQGIGDYLAEKNKRLIDEDYGEIDE